jgi:OOP family OmpA-OmpF porin
VKKFVIALAATAACLLSTGAMAQVYVSGATGIGRIDMDCAGTTSCSDSDLAVKLTAGYTFFDGLSAELGYVNFGRADAAAEGITAKARATAFTLGLAYQLPLNDSWGLGFRLGAANVKSSLSGTVDGLGGASISDTKTAPYYGLGVNFAVTKKVKFEAAADFSRAEIEGDKADLRAVTFGVRYDF